MQPNTKNVYVHLRIDRNRTVKSVQIIFVFRYSSSSTLTVTFFIEIFRLSYTCNLRSARFNVRYAMRAARVRSHTSPVWVE